MVLVLLVFLGFVFGISFEEALSLFEGSEAMKAIEEKKRALEGRVISARALRNPEFRFESGFFSTTEGGPEGRLLYIGEITQEIPLWGVREKREKVARSEVRALVWELEGLRNGLLSDFYRAFYGALLAKEVLQIARRELKTAEGIRDFVRKAYEMGQRTELELMRAVRLYEGARLEVSRALGRYRSALRELSYYVGREVKEVEGNLYEVPEFRLPRPEETPPVLALSERVRYYTNSASLHKALALPLPRTGLMAEDAGGYYGFRWTLSFELPLFYRNRGEILESLRMREATELELSSQKRRVSSLLSSISEREKVLRESIRRLEEVLLVRAKKELSAGMKSYRLGLISLLELSDIKRAYFSLLRERALLYAELHELYAELIKLGGMKR
ncbi:MAG: TolC family protein [Aquificae bacterium]|nr:TolC family protein [Aquificota bacterium]